VTTGALNFDDALNQLQVNGSAQLQLSTAVRDGENLVQLSGVSDGILLAEFTAMETYTFNLDGGALSVTPVL
jgi:hypothetical protein